MRVSRTYTLPRIEQNSPLNSAGISAIGDVDGVTLNGQLGVSADVNFTISFGVDSGGFYLVPGNGVLASLAVGGNIEASIPNGSIRGNAAIGLSADVALKTTNSDGRIRLTDIDGDPTSATLANNTNLIVRGNAGVNLDFSQNIGGAGPIQFGGDWIWDLNAQGNGFVLDAEASGLNQEEFFDSVATLVANQLGTVRSKLEQSVTDSLAANLSFLDDGVAESFAATISDGFALDLELGSARTALAEQGFELVSVVDAGAFLNSAIDGESHGQDLLRIRFRNDATKQLTFDVNDLKDFLNASLPSQFQLDDIADDKISVTTSLSGSADVTFGVGGDGGFFLADAGEARPDEFSLNASVEINIDQIGGSVGPMFAGVAEGSGALDVSLGLDLVASSGEKISLNQIVNGFSNVTDATVNATTSLELPLALKLGETGPGVITEFTAFGEVHSPIEFTFGPDNSSDPKAGFGPIKFELGDFVKNMIAPVIHQVNATNPLPDDVVNLLTAPLPLYGKSVLKLLQQFDDSGQYDLVSFLFEVSKVAKDLGSYINSGNNLDLSSYGLGSAPANPGEGSGDGGNTGPFDDLLGKLAEYDIELPILEDTGSKILQMIFNPETELDLIIWDPPRFELSKEARVLTVPIAELWCSIRFGASRQPDCRRRIWLLWRR